MSHHNKVALRNCKQIVKIKTEYNIELYTQFS